MVECVSSCENGWIWEQLNCENNAMSFRRTLWLACIWWKEPKKSDNIKTEQCVGFIQAPGRNLQREKSLKSVWLRVTHFKMPESVLTHQGIELLSKTILQFLQETTGFRFYHFLRVIILKGTFSHQGREFLVFCSTFHWFK